MQAVGWVLLGAVIGIAAGLTGLGGGFLVVPLLLLLGRHHTVAVGTSFVTILLLGVSALFAHGRLEHVDYKVGVLLGLGGIAGAQWGARLVSQLEPETFSRVFAVILFALAIKMFFWPR